MKRQTAAAVHIALCTTFPEILDRTIVAANEHLELEEFLSEGYLQCLYFRDSVTVPQLEALPEFAKES